MYKIVLTVILFVAGVVCVCIAADESAEPAVKYRLVVNGKGHEIVLGKPLKLEGTFTNPEIVLSRAPTRLFGYAGVEFRYPAYFTWEADLDSEACRIWTVSGNDFKVMFFLFKAPVSLERYALALVKRFGAENTKVTDCECELGGVKYKGKKLEVHLVKSLVSTELYPVKSKSGSAFITFQDIPPDDKSVSDEKVKTLKLVSKTFKIKAPAGDEPGPGK